MWFVEYYIAGDPLVKTRLVERDNIAECVEELHLGNDLMSIRIVWIQEKI